MGQRWRKKGRLAQDPPSILLAPSRNSMSNSWPAPAKSKHSPPECTGDVGLEAGATATAVRAAAAAREMETVAAAPGETAATVAPATAIACVVPAAVAPGKPHSSNDNSRWKGRAVLPLPVANTMPPTITAATEDAATGASTWKTHNPMGRRLRVAIENTARNQRSGLPQRRAISSTWKPLSSAASPQQDGS